MKAIEKLRAVEDLCTHLNVSLDVNSLKVDDVQYLMKERGNLAEAHFFPRDLDEIVFVLASDQYKVLKEDNLQDSFKFKGDSTDLSLTKAEMSVLLSAVEKHIATLSAQEIRWRQKVNRLRVDPKDLKGYQFFDENFKSLTQIYKKIIETKRD